MRVRACVCVCIYIYICIYMYTYVLIYPHTSHTRLPNARRQPRKATQLFGTAPLRAEIPGASSPIFVCAWVCIASMHRNIGEEAPRIHICISLISYIRRCMSMHCEYTYEYRRGSAAWKISSNFLFFLYSYVREYALRVYIRI